MVELGVQTRSFGSESTPITALCATSQAPAQAVGTQYKTMERAGLTRQSLLHLQTKGGQCSWRVEREGNKVDDEPGLAGRSTSLRCLGHSEELVSAWQKHITRRSKGIFFGGGTLWGLWDLSSPTRDWTFTPRIGNTVLTTRPPGKSLRRISDPFVATDLGCRRQQRSFFYYGLASVPARIGDPGPIIALSPLAVPQGPLPGQD